MSTKIICDGCDAPLDERDVVLEGQRANGLGGGGLPSGDFHLCLACSTVAFHAAVTRPPVVDTHDIARAIGDAQRARRSTR